MCYLKSDIPQHVVRINIREVTVTPDDGHTVVTLEVEGSGKCVFGCRRGEGSGLAGHGVSQAQLLRGYGVLHCLTGREVPQQQHAAVLGVADRWDLLAAIYIYNDKRRPELFTKFNLRILSAKFTHQESANLVLENLQHHIFGQRRVHSSWLRLGLCDTDGERGVRSGLRSRGIGAVAVTRIYRQHVKGALLQSLERFIFNFSSAAAAVAAAATSVRVLVRSVGAATPS